MINHYTISAFLTALSSPALGIFVYLKGRDKSLNRLWLLFTFCVGAYGAWATWGSLEQNHAVALWVWRLMYPLGVIWIAPTFYHFVRHFCGLQENRPATIQYLIGTFFACVAFTPIWFPDVQYVFGQFFYGSAGPMFPIYFIWWTGLVLLCHIHLSRYFRIASGIKRTQIVYFFLATVIGYSGGSLAYLPIFGIDLFPYGTYCIPIYTLIMSYAILQYRLFDIHVAVRKSLTYSMLLTCLTIFYFASLTVAERLLRIHIGYHSIALSVAIFVILSLLFQPLKLWSQRLVDLLFFKAPQQALVKRLEQLEREAQRTEKLKAVATLAAGLCHELRNPLQTIRTHAEFLSERYDDPRFRNQFAEVMRTEIARIDEFLKQLMEFARPKSPATRELEPHKILDSTLDLLSNEFVRRGVQLDKDYQVNGLQLQADPDQIRQVILNLTLNALEAVGQKGKVAIRTNRENGWFTLEISDTGPGIDPKILPKLFEPFITTKPDGNGLGLSIVHSIVREHRGKILVQSQPGRGTTFILKFPVL